MVDKWYERAAERLKAGVKHKRHVQLLVEIRECNDTLHHLVGDILDMAPIRTDRRSKLDAKKWESLRKLAANLHSTLEGRLSCNCGHCHMADLRLETRNGKEELEVRFSVVFTLDARPKDWHETEITIVRAEIPRYVERPRYLLKPNILIVVRDTDTSESRARIVQGHD